MGGSASELRLTLLQNHLCSKHLQDLEFIFERMIFHSFYNLVMKLQGSLDVLVGQLLCLQFGF
jgi:hypothetical protein